MNEYLNSTWNLWFHKIINNWKITGYEKLLEIKNIKELLYFMNNYDKIGGLNNNHYFLMRENITPIWEDPLNIKGGCISLKVDINEVELKWNKLCAYILGESIPNSLLVNGISVCIKNPNYSIIQIWLKEKNSEILNFINEYFDNNYIYKSYNIKY